MKNKPVAWYDSEEYGSIRWASEWALSEGTPFYTHPVKEQELLTEIEVLKEINAKQVDYIAEQKSAYEKLWKEHMELFWKHEQDTDLTNE